MGAGFVRATRVALAAISLALGVASPVHAVDAFWQGRRDAVWNHGINPNNGISNWYSRAPLKGQPRDMPNGGAIFAEGAREYDIEIRGHQQAVLLVFRKNSERYKFDIRNSLTIRNGGIQNYDPSPPLFTILPDASLYFRENAALVSHGDWPSASIKLGRNGLLSFGDRSRGGTAAVQNFGGGVYFTGMASAERMTIINRSQTESVHGSHTIFWGRSTGGDAQFENGRNGHLDFAETRGPPGEGVSAGRINSQGKLHIGTTTLQVRESFTQEAKGTLSIDHDGAKHGRLVVENDMRLGGTLLATGFFRPELTGRHTILRAKGQRLGKFDNEVLNGGRLEYGPKTVVLVIGD